MSQSTHLVGILVTGGFQATVVEKGELGRGNGSLCVENARCRGAEWSAASGQGSGLSRPIGDSRCVWRCKCGGGATKKITECCQIEVLAWENIGPGNLKKVEAESWAQLQNAGRPRFADPRTVYNTLRVYSRTQCEERDP